MSGIAKIIGVAGSVIAFGLARESYDGHRNIWQHKAEMEFDRRRWEDLQDNWGSYSGLTGMDKANSDLNSFLRHGPFGIFDAMTRRKHAVEGFINDVLLPNSLPIALAIGGLHAGFGNIIYQPFIRTYNYFKSNPPGLITHSWKGLKSGAKQVGKGLLWSGQKASELIIKGKWASAAIAAIGAFSLIRFLNVRSGYQQYHFLRDQVLGNPEGGESM